MSAGGAKVLGYRLLERDRCDTGKATPGRLLYRRGRGPGVVATRKWTGLVVNTSATAVVMEAGDGDSTACKKGRNDFGLDMKGESYMLKDEGHGFPKGAASTIHRPLLPAQVNCETEACVFDAKSGLLRKPSLLRKSTLGIVRGLKEMKANDRDFRNPSFAKSLKACRRPDRPDKPRPRRRAFDKMLILLPSNRKFQRGGGSVTSG